MGSRRSRRKGRAGHEALATHHVGGRGDHVGRRRYWGHARQGGGGSVSEQLVRSVSLRQRILGGQQSLCGRAVPLPLGVLLEGVGDGDRSVAQILT